ncbi:hypothetical protein BDN70DRAFT_859095 [Pholiota conissans]|uniref:RRM domain-containing protein n=1 Tax=Pholiota conissans TaxID=109636 RepID=A0A9P5Z1J0_9AGAR|nr:hypothetical protein BDN70DRAFT_859095 [Pholiota conissans]
MDKSLDEIISSKPKTGRRPSGRRSGAGAAAARQVLGKPAVTPVQRARAAAAPVDSRKVATQASEKIVVSNLPGDVNEAQIRDLFTTTIGPLKEVNLHYDAAGRSKGVATIVFQKKADGAKAHQQYHNRLIDGKRPMKIEIVVDPSQNVSLASRVGPASGAPANGKPQAARTGAPRGRRTGRGRGGARKADRPPKTAADLDAEMEDYTAGNAPAPAAAA